MSDRDYNVERKPIPTVSTTFIALKSTSVDVPSSLRPVKGTLESFVENDTCVPPDKDRQETVGCDCFCPFGFETPSSRSEGA